MKFKTEINFIESDFIKMAETKFSDFCDPATEEAKKIPLARKISQIKVLNDGLKILDLADEWLPHWVVNSSANKFSIDLITLQQKWEALTLMAGKTCKHIVLVRDIGLDPRGKAYPNTSLLRTFCDRLTELGYMVMDNAIFSNCVKCQRLIVSESVIERRKAHANAMKIVYTGCCNECQPQQAFIDTQNKLRELYKQAQSTREDK